VIDARVASARLLARSLLPVAILFAPPLARAQICNVPSQRPTVQTAVGDPTCAQVVLAAGTYLESVTITRTLTLQGDGPSSSRITGRLLVLGTGTSLTLSRLAVDTRAGRAGCYSSALEVCPGATATPTAVVVENAAGTPAGPCPLFADGFEAGAKGSWSASSP
jgi:hypothetical protein